MNDEAGALTKLYIGQTRKGISRLDDHNAKRKSLLFDGGIVQKADRKYYLTKVISFRTPSGASDFVLGGSTNGWVEWRDKDGKTLDEFF